jgi:hypothetical protein
LPCSSKSKDAQYRKTPHCASMVFLFLFWLSPMDRTSQLCLQNAPDVAFAYSVILHSLIFCRADFSAWAEDKELPSSFAYRSAARFAFILTTLRPQLMHNLASRMHETARSPFVAAQASYPTVKAV